ncbi:ATP-dependent Clp protease ATP-binding subunit [Salipaludibacillus agaradhaerens]|uniref:AAA family ATPase n=1 Tax=Salipaludibacillus agaradhaerens TaxID=76935 RepID=UPI0021515F1B|nr:AAA family ATPase [Salipaludibacillus agaradhaerens]MCR6108742.1 ATP-dependent Clp protease ATP-binding subunit [Salipaludibacillus agaradhaerens]MCR6120583.1 ATP-dependent Clp protease ATP-binding subunit [Salipaludibacillus agaradhaerens]
MSIATIDRPSTLEVVDTEAWAFDKDKYPFLSQYADFMPPPSRPVIGRDREIRRLLASLNRAELSNAFLLGDAGSGKTMLVQGTSERDIGRLYVEVDLAKMAASENGEDGSVQMASRVKGLFDDALRFKQEVKNQQGASENNNLRKKQTRGLELVMFIDEFHLLVQLSPAAAQAIKPILAESGRRGIKIIAATTFAEFHEYVEKDQALMQRLQRINIREPDKKTVISILKSIAKSHGVLDDVYDPQLFELIYDYSNRYVPADSQPRKSILMLDSMIGWYRTYPTEYKMDRHLLAEVIFDSTGVQVTFEINGRHIEDMMNQRVYSQKFAMKTLEQRLQIAVADLHDKSRPISSFLFTGPTGTGKTETVKGLAELLFGDERAMIRFDMSEYALESSLDRFREELTMKVWNKSHSILLFDEIEKANRAITRLLLQVLDDGRLSNSQGREVSFLNTYIVLTTNAGSEVYQNIAHYSQEEDKENGLAEYQKVIRRSLISNEAFAPEIINRMNAIIPFQPLGYKTYEKIILNKLRKLQDDVYRLHGVEVMLELNVLTYLVHENNDIDTNTGGARGLVARMDTEVISPVSRYINSHPNAKHIGVHVKGEMMCKNKNIRKSEARIEVGTVDKKRARRS